MGLDLCNVDDAEVAMLSTMTTTTTYRHGVTESEWVSVGLVRACGILSESIQVVARRLLLLGIVVCFDCRMLAIGRIDSPDFDCSSREDLDRVSHELRWTEAVVVERRSVQMMEVVEERLSSVRDLETVLQRHEPVGHRNCADDDDALEVGVDVDVAIATVRIERMVAVVRHSDFWCLKWQAAMHSPRCAPGIGDQSGLCFPCWMSHECRCCCDIAPTRVWWSFVVSLFGFSVVESLEFHIEHRFDLRSYLLLGWRRPVKGLNWK